MSQEVDNFLAHYGKKGMKWGVRKNLKSLGKGVSEKYKNLDPKKKAALKVGLTTALVAGTAATTAIISRKGMIPMSEARSAVKNTADIIRKSALDAEGNFMKEILDMNVMHIVEAGAWVWD